MENVKLGHRWTTIRTYGWSSSVTENDGAAAGGVVFLQARKTRTGQTLFRKVASNGKKKAVGKSWTE